MVPTGPKSLFLTRDDRILWLGRGKVIPRAGDFILFPGDRKRRKLTGRCVSMRFCPSWSLQLVRNLSGVSGEKRVKVGNKLAVSLNLIWTDQRKNKKVKEKSNVIIITVWMLSLCPNHHPRKPSKTDGSPWYSPRNGKFPSTFWSSNLISPATILVHSPPPTPANRNAQWLHKVGGFRGRRRYRGRNHGCIPNWCHKYKFKWRVKSKQEYKLAGLERC